MGDEIEKERPVPATRTKDEENDSAKTLAEERESLGKAPVRRPLEEEDELANEPRKAPVRRPLEEEDELANEPRKAPVRRTLPLTSNERDELRNKPRKVQDNYDTVDTESNAEEDDETPRRSSSRRNLLSEQTKDDAKEPVKEK